ncbi:cofilin [Bisporella sp. PMI_857]|nr:cofilin [Bisporella sp. PMI_857]
MSQSGVEVKGECLEEFNNLKMKQQWKFIIYQLTKDYKQIEIEHKSTEQDWDTFRELLVNAKSVGIGGQEKKGPRYAVYDLKYEEADGAQRQKIVFIAWSPDDAGIKPKMVYASSKDALKRTLNVADELQANDEDDIEEAEVLKKISKGKAVSK